MEKKTDQRVRLTRDLLKNALVHQMQSQHISKISVRALCDIAGINRSTFYAHFQDPMDLLRGVQAEVMTNLTDYLRKQEYADNTPVSVQELTRIVEYAKANAELFKALLSENCDFAFQQDIVQLAQSIPVGYNPKHGERVKEYINTFSINGCVSVLQKWLHEGMIESPAECQPRSFAIPSRRLSGSMAMGF